MSEKLARGCADDVMRKVRGHVWHCRCPSARCAASPPSPGRSARRPPSLCTHASATHQAAVAQLGLSRGKQLLICHRICHLALPVLLIPRAPLPPSNVCLSARNSFLRPIQAHLPPKLHFPPHSPFSHPQRCLKDPRRARCLWLLQPCNLSPPPHVRDGKGLH